MHEQFNINPRPAPGFEKGKILGNKEIEGLRQELNEIYEQLFFAKGKKKDELMKRSKEIRKRLEELSSGK